MADPQEIYDRADDTRRDMLRRVWPDLNDVLAAAHKQATEGRVIRCVLDHPENPRPEAVGRLTLNGHVVCAEHLKRSSRRGGYPLQRVDARTWRE